MAGKRLTPRQAAFIREYLIDLNATQAAIRAGYSPKTARSQGQRLLTNADIQQALEAAQAKAAAKANITVQDVLNGLKTEAENTGEGSSHAARVAAWAHLGKHLGMFTDKQEHSGDIRIRIIRD